jgi:Tfp pilus assembly protein PilF
MPNLVEARLNLGTALMNAGKDAEALAEFERVLEQNPGSELARKSAEAIRTRLGSERPD